MNINESSPIAPPDALLALDSSRTHLYPDEYPVYNLLIISLFKMIFIEVQHIISPAWLMTEAVGLTWPLRFVAKQLETCQRSSRWRSHASGYAIPTADARQFGRGP